MSISTQGHYWHDVYEDSPHKADIDDAYTACRRSLEANGLVLANDDRAEELVAAITKYVVESKT